MSKNLATILRNFAADLADFLDDQGEAITVENVKAKSGRTKPAPEPEVDDTEDEADDTGSKFNRDDLAKKTVAALRKIAIQEGFDPEDVADASKDDIIDALMDDEADEDEDDESEVEEADEEESEDEEDEDDEESDEYTRDDFEEMSLAEVKAAAKEAGYTVADMKVLDKDGIIDLILGEADEESDEGEDEYLTEDDLQAMSLADLKVVAAENGVKVVAGMKKADIIEAILEASE